MASRPSIFRGPLPAGKRRRLHALALVGAIAAAAVVVTAGGTVLLLGIGRTPAQRPRPAPPRRCTAEQPCLAIVIDDIGRDLDMLRQLVPIHPRLSFAVLPHARFTAPSLELLTASRRSIIAHLPMMPTDPGQITDEPVVIGRLPPPRTDLGQSTGMAISAQVVACLAPFRARVHGVNNHMGSQLTQDAQAVSAVLGELAARKLWVLDSRTAKGSVLCAQAWRRTVRCIARDVFLDSDSKQGTVMHQLKLAVEIARQRGFAVAIGHPRAETLQVLKQMAAKLPVRIERIETVVNAAFAATAAGKDVT